MSGNGITAWVWFDYAYYDGLLCFGQGCSVGATVKWCGEKLPVVAENRNGAAR